MRPDPAGRRGAIESVLLDYHRSPGKYAAVRHQPSLLYGAVREVLLLASGRAPDAGGGTPPSAGVRQAAVFFIRTALLRPDADHYELLGLARDADAGAVKDRYRQMMRLTHPDFSATHSGSAWPADAATRINLAYEVLSSAVNRRAYDAALGPAEPSPKPAAAAVRSNAAALPTRRAPTDSRVLLKRLSAVFGTAGGIALIAFGLASLQNENKDSLVQRDTAPAPRGARQPDTAQQSPDGGRQPQVALTAADTPTQAAQQPAAPTMMAALVQAIPAPVARSAVPRVVEAMPAVPVVTGQSPTAPQPAGSAAESPLPAAPPPAAPPAATVVEAPVPEPVLPRAQAAAGPTLAQVHPLLARLLQEIESGRSERVMGLVDREARTAPAAQALVMYYNSLVDGAQPVKVSDVKFRAQPQDGRLLVTGRLMVLGRAAPPRELAVQAEFTHRDGGIVMTRLARAPD